MSEKKAMIRAYVAEGLQVSKALQIAEISHNQYYYQSTGGAPGREVTVTTKCMIQGQIIECPNAEVVEEMEKILEDPDLQYGYKRMTAAMLLLGYLIGCKKIYRLMKENGLLQERRRPGTCKRVRYRRVTPTRPLEVIEMDIKYQWVEEHQRDAYIFTILDTFTRVILYKYVGYHIRQQEVKAAWEYVIVHILQPLDMLNRKLTIEVRNDNGPQFAAKLVQSFFAENQLGQVFTHPYTPQENGHIESFHAIVGEHLDRFSFNTIEELAKNIDVFYHKYNRVRLHGSIACLPPVIFWNLFDQGHIKTTLAKHHRRIFKLTVPYWELSGNESLREFPVQTEVRRTSKKERAAA